jgi:hypothetical protein
MTIGAVYAVGFPAMQDARDAEQTSNMERAFEVLDDNFDDIVHQGAPSRATEIKLSGGQLSMSETTTIDVYVENTSNASRNTSISASTRPIVYSSDDTEFALAFGAIIRSDGGNAVIRSRPNWLIDDRGTVLPFLLTVQGEGRNSIAGSGTMLVVGHGRPPGVAGSFEPNGSARAKVTLTITSKRADAWGRYMDSRGMNPVDDDPSDGTVSYRFETDSITLPKRVIDVEFSS